MSFILWLSITISGSNDCLYERVLIQSSMDSLYITSNSIQFALKLERKQEDYYVMSEGEDTYYVQGGPSELGYILFIVASKTKKGIVLSSGNKCN